MKTSILHLRTLYLALALFFQFCSETPQDVPIPEAGPDKGLLEQRALQDEYVAADLHAMIDVETEGVVVTGHRRDSVQSVKLIRKTRFIERSSEITKPNDSTTFLFLRKRTAGEAFIIHEQEDSSGKQKQLWKKHLAESFTRMIVFTYDRKDSNHENEKVRGVVSNLTVDCGLMSGTFTVTTGNISRLIFVTAGTEFDDLSCSTLRNGDIVKVKIKRSFTDSLGQTGWAAEEIERDENDHKKEYARWKKTGISLVEGGTETRSAHITGLQIAFTDSMVVTVLSPLEFLSHYGALLPRFPHCRIAEPIRLTVTVESSKPVPEIVFVRRGSIEHGKVSLKKQLRLTSENVQNGLYRRIYELTVPAHEHRGKHHSILEVWTHESLYDSTAQISTHVWGLPYVVR